MNVKMDKGLENKILASITEKRINSKEFYEIIGEFDNKFSEFNCIENRFKISDYFKEGTGHKTITRELIENGRIQQEWLRDYTTKSGKVKTDFKGLYIFLHEKTPFYVGISKGVIGRVIQHIKGHNHSTSTLAYKIGLKHYELRTGFKHDGSRDELNFKEEVEPAKEFLSRQNIAWLNIENNEELFLFEVFCSMKLKTILNDFETH